MSGSPALYSLTLQRPSAINAAVVGQFQQNSKTQQILLGRGPWLELLHPDQDTGKLVLLVRTNVFATVRNLACFKIAGAGHDYILMTSDSGKISVLSYDHSQNQLKLVRQESYGKSGIRRTVAGEYLACDAKGRATMIGSIEKSRLVYVLNRSETGEVTVSSPLESSIAFGILYDLVGLDVGYENPVFAALEAVYNEDPVPNPAPVVKRVAFYELDLGLNHTLPKGSTPVEFSANKLIALPGGTKGPSGVVVCSDNRLTYIHPNQSALHVYLPSQNSAPNYAVSAVMHKLGESFFVLVQDVHGVIFKLNFELVEENTTPRWGGRQSVTNLVLQQFGQAPPSSFLGVFKAGFLFCATFSGDHLLYQFNTLGDEDDVPKLTSANYEIVPYTLSELENISVLDKSSAINPVVASAILNLRKDETPQIYTACGRDTFSSLRAIEYGLEVSELINSPLPAEPLAVFTTKKTVDDVYDRYIVLSFSNETLVLDIGDEVTEVSDSGLVKGVSTLAVQQVGLSSLIQVHQKGLVHITKDKTITEWKPPKGAEILHCCANNNQVLLGLSNRELVYFESDTDGMLIEYSKREKMPADITALAIGPLPKGRVRSLYAAVGSKDETLRLVSLDLGTTLETMSIQGLSAPPAAICILQDDAGLCVHIGLQNGVYIVTTLDTTRGELGDTKTRFLGPAAVKIGRVWTTDDDRESALALCTKPWLARASQLGLDLVPLTYSRLTSAAPFSSADCPKGAVAISKNSLAILQIERRKDNIHHRNIDLDQTPRRLVTNSLTSYLYTLCTGITGSSIKVLDPAKTETVLGTTPLHPDEYGLALCNCRFQVRGKEYLVVSAAKNFKQMLGSPVTYEACYVHVYEYTGSPFGTTLELIHSTKMATPANVLTGYKGMLLAGCGNTLILYDIGKKQLLKRAACVLDNARDIRALAVSRDRVIVGDGKHSVTFVKYEKCEDVSEDGAEATLTAFADDPIPRSITSLVLLDYDTVAVGDKFGNMAVLRCPRSVPANISAAIIASKDPVANGCPYKLELLCHFYTADIPVGLHKATFSSGGFEAIIWVGIQGTIGAFIPVLSSRDAKFLTQLEGEMRSVLSMRSASNLAGRDHLTFRGYYAPPKQVVDGDLCEMFYKLSTADREKVAHELDREVGEIERRLTDLRTQSVF